MDNSAVNDRPWSPYVAGSLTGLAITLAYLFCDASFGATPFYAWLSKGTKALLDGRSLLATDQYGRLSLGIGWMQMFAFGIPLGALLAALLYREFRIVAVPSVWRGRFGPGWKKRALWAFVGAAISMIGVRLATGCPSGLGLSGMVEHSLGGWVGFAAFFIGGVMMARLLFRHREPGTGGGGDE